MCAHTYTYTIFFIYSSVDGHICWFHILATVNNAAKNLGCMYFFKLVFLYKYTLRCGIVGSYGNSTLTLRGTSILFSTGTAPVYIPTNSVQGFSFLYILANICVFFSMITILAGVRWHLILVLSCVSLIISKVEHLFLCLLSSCNSSLSKNLYSVLSPIFYYAVCILMLSCVSCAYMLDIISYINCI